MFFPNGEQVKILIEEKIGVTRFSNSFLDVECYQFLDTPPIGCVKENIDDFANTYDGQYIKKLLDNVEYNTSFTLKLIQEVLPSKLVFMFFSRILNGCCFLYSQGSYVHSPTYNGNIKRQICWLTKNCINTGDVEGERFNLTWWELKNQYNIHEYYDMNHTHCNDLGVIVDKHLRRNQTKRSLLGQINGTIGSLNNKRSQYSIEQFFEIIMQKLSCKEELSQVFKDKDFPYAVASWIEILYKHS